MMMWRLRNFARDNAAATAVEFALIAPILCFLVVGAAWFALAVFNYSSLTEGVRSGARQLAVSLNDSTPYTDAVAAVTSAAPSLTAPASQPCTNSATQLCITMSVDGTACTTDSTCAAQMVGGKAASVTGTYPCTVVVMGHNFLPSCQLTSTAAEMIE